MSNPPSRMSIDSPATPETGGVGVFVEVRPPLLVCAELDESESPSISDELPDELAIAMVGYWPDDDDKATVGV